MNRKLPIHPNGFTLLEVLIALAILAMTMTAIMGRQGNILQYTHYIRHATVAAQIARIRLLEVEHVQRQDCFETEEGEVFDEQCGEDGLFEEFHCVIICEKMDANEEILEGITAQVENMVKGVSGDEDLSALTGREQLAGGMETMMPAMDPAALAQAAAMLTGFIPTFLQIMDQKVRKVTLTVTWKEGRKEREQVFTQYVVNTKES